MKVTVLTQGAWWLARRLEAAGHTVRCYTGGPAGGGFIEKLTAPMVPDGTDLLVLDGDPFRSQVRQARARRIPVIGGDATPRLPAQPTFTSLAQGLAYVATHQGPWETRGEVLDGQDAARVLRWQTRQPGDPLTLTPHVPTARWLGGWSDGKRLVGPFVTWEAIGGQTRAARVENGLPLAQVTGLGGYVGFLGGRCDRTRVLEVTTDLPVAVGLLLDGDLASQWQRLARGELDAMTTRSDGVQTTEVRGFPTGFPLPSRFLRKDVVLDGVAMRDGGLAMVGTRVGWTWGPSAVSPGRPVRPRPGLWAPAADADSLGDDSNDEGTPDGAAAD